MTLLDSTAEQRTPQPEASYPTEDLGRPWPLGLIGVGLTIALVSRLVAANGLAELTGRNVTLALALAAAIIGSGLLAFAANRDRLGTQVAWLAVLTAAAFAAFSWVSPPFTDTTFAWDERQQTSLAILGAGVGLVLAGMLAVAFVRRVPTATVATTLTAAALALLSLTLLRTDEWFGIASLAVAFALLLLAWDRSPRAERLFLPPINPPRIPRALMGLCTLALAGAAIQIWLSRDTVPRAAPAVVVAFATVAAAFASMLALRREIERRQSPFDELTAWMHEARSGDFQGELERYGIDAGAAEPLDRPLSFPNLTVPDAASPEPVDAARQPAGPLLSPDLAPAPVLAVPTVPPVPAAEADAAHIYVPADASGAFSRQVVRTDSLLGLDALGAWLDQHTMGSSSRVIGAVEIMSLDRFDALDDSAKAQVQQAAVALLRAAVPDAEIIAVVDGPYFMTVHERVTPDRLLEINASLLKAVGSRMTTAGGSFRLDGTLALLLPERRPTLEQLVDEAIIGLLQARLLQPAVP